MMSSGWLEIPVDDLARATAFYEAVFEHAPTEVIVDGDRRITVIEGTPTVSLDQTPGFVPTEHGTLPCFHLDGPIADAPTRVAAAGGRIVEPAAPRADRGLFSRVTDTGGNGPYLHAAS